jgi:hypothetical protein
LRKDAAAPANYSVRIRAADLASNQGVATASVAVQP